MTVSIGLGESIPPDTAHAIQAVSVSLPTWRSNVGYEEGEPWVVQKMVTGYPRFFIHNSIKAFAAAIVDRFAKPGQTAVLFSSQAAAARCLAFMNKFADTIDSTQTLADLTAVHLVLDPSNPAAAPVRSLAPTISAVLLHPDAFPLAKQYWQHTGDGISSRRAEFCHKLFADGLLVEAPVAKAAAEKAAAASAAAVKPPSPSTSSTAIPGMKPLRGPMRYRRPMSPTSPAAAVPSFAAAAPSSPRSPTSTAEDDDESSRFLEERYGRNLDLSFVRRARAAILRRITGALTAKDHAEAASPPEATTTTTTTTEAQPLRGVAVQEDDVYLLPCGMNAIFNAHRFLLAARPDHAHLKSINFGFPYVDTLKILQKFGAGCLFYGHASEQDLDDLEARLAGGERFLALFCEFPGNPLLTCPNLVRIRQLADRYDFAVVVDETIGTFANVNVLPYADMVVSSLTKIFSGDCNVMGGSLVLNRRLPRYYSLLKAVAAEEYDADAYWPEDAIFMERNSRDFAARVERINHNAEAICDVLRASPQVKELHYPKFCPTRANYDVCRLPTSASGYGGLLSCSFQTHAQAVAFYDTLESAKGPSLGTNFTLTSPYVVLAHYGELDWCRSLGVDPDLVRVSVGLEDTDDLRRRFGVALAAAAAAEQALSPED